MNIGFNNIDEMKALGFSGFKTKAELFLDSSDIPKVRGVYMVLHTAPRPPEFLETGTGGFFKGRNPNISLPELRMNWVEDTNVIYIGKVGGPASKATLHSRLRQYLRFGQGKPVGHWGGRLIWQLKNHQNLVVCWKPLIEEEPRPIEIQLIQAFVLKYGKRPFANLAN